MWNWAMAIAFGGMLAWIGHGFFRRPDRMIRDWLVMIFLTIAFLCQFAQALYPDTLEPLALAVATPAFSILTILACLYDLCVPRPY